MIIKRSSTQLETVSYGRTNFNVTTSYAGVVKPAVNRLVYRWRH